MTREAKLRSQPAAWLESMKINTHRSSSTGERDILCVETNAMWRRNWEKETSAVSEAEVEVDFFVHTKIVCFLQPRELTSLLCRHCEFNFYIFRRLCECDIVVIGRMLFEQARERETRINISSFRRVVHIRCYIVLIQIFSREGSFGSSLYNIFWISTRSLLARAGKECEKRLETLLDFLIWLNQQWLEKFAWFFEAFSVFPPRQSREVFSLIFLKLECHVGHETLKMWACWHFRWVLLRGEFFFAVVFYEQKLMIQDHLNDGGRMTNLKIKPNLHSTARENPIFFRTKNRTR